MVRRWADNKFSREKWNIWVRPWYLQYDTAVHLWERILNDVWIESKKPVGNISILAQIKRILLFWRNAFGMEDNSYWNPEIIIQLMDADVLIKKFDAIKKDKERVLGFCDYLIWLIKIQSAYVRSDYAGRYKVTVKTEEKLYTWASISPQRELYYCQKLQDLKIKIEKSSSSVDYILELFEYMSRIWIFTKNNKRYMIEENLKSGWLRDRHFEDKNR